MERKYTAEGRIVFRDGKRIADFADAATAEDMAIHLEQAYIAGQLDGVKAVRDIINDVTDPAEGPAANPASGARTEPRPAAIPDLASQEFAAGFFRAPLVKGGQGRADYDPPATRYMNGIDGGVR